MICKIIIILCIKFAKNDIENDLEKYKKTINIYEIFKKLNQNWGFKVFDNYKIVLTYYGTGGSYHYKTGEIIIRHKREVKKPYFYTIFHEAIHIGIEENIVRNIIYHNNKKKVLLMLSVANICQTIYNKKWI